MGSHNQSSLDDQVTAVPGTEFLYDLSQTSGPSSEFDQYQHLSKGDSHILLVPQPSTTDPNDPLRWSAWVKTGILANALAYGFLGGVTGPMMAAWMVPGSAFFHIDLQMMAVSNGATLMCQGVFNALWMPFAVKYGRRPVYLFSTLLMIGACVWLARASQTTFTSFVVGRVFLGIWEAPIESIVPSTITDTFFLHERGAMVSLYGLSVLGGNELGPMLSAFIIQYLGMYWAYYIVAMLLGLTLVTMIFAMPETKFTGYRPVIVPRSLAKGQDATMNEKSQAIHQECEVSESGMSNHLPKRSWWQEVTRLPQSDPDVNLFHAFLRPFVLAAYPTVLWSCLIYGMALSWNVILSCSVAQLFAPPPYSFNSAAQGLVFLSPFVGSLVGTYLCGPLADQVANYLTRRGDGIREPEMRLPICMVAAALTLIGAVASGLMFHYEVRWIGPVIGFGILSTGAQMGATLSMSYALDCHKERAVELMVAVAALKSALAWIWTWVTNDWLTRDGPLIVFSSVAAISTAVYLTTIIFVMKGKHIRLWLAEKHIGKSIGL